VIENSVGGLSTHTSQFGDYDFVLITELPDNVSAAALAIAALRRRLQIRQDHSADGSAEASKPFERRLPPDIALQRAAEPRRHSLRGFSAAPSTESGASPHDWDALLFQYVWSIRRCSRPMAARLAGMMVG